MLRRPLALLLLACAPCLAAPPTDEAVQAFVTQVNDAAKGAANYAEAQKAKASAAAESVDSLSISEASLAQIEMLAPLGPLPALVIELDPRLAELAKQPTVDGARAAELRLGYIYVAPGEGREVRTQRMSEAAVAALTHPAALDLIRSGKGDRILASTGQITTEHAKQHNAVVAVERLIVPDLSLVAASSLPQVVQFVTNDDLAVNAADRARLLDRVVAAATAAVETPEAAEAANARRADYVRSVIALANGPWARGTLLNNPAPEVKFTWTNAEKPATTLADYKGKVVILDFWATWCGPCIATFPNIRKLEAHYEGYPVEIIGVTSIQGFHIDRENNNQRVDTKGDPQKEMDLMPGFIKHMDMTWTVAFSEDSCFNPNFGVRGIPHVAIVDPAGKVRYNGLHPGGDLNEKIAKIDALLKEYGLPTPTPPDANANAESSGN